MDTDYLELELGQFCVGSKWPCLSIILWWHATCTLITMWEGGALGCLLFVFATDQGVVLIVPAVMSSAMASTIKISTTVKTIIWQQPYRKYLVSGAQTFNEP